MQTDAGRPRDARNLGNRLHRSQLVVGVHHRHQDRVPPQRPPNRIRIHDSACGHRHVRHRHTLALELRAGIHHGRMLDGGRDHVLGCTRRFRPHSAQDGEIVRFGAAAGKHHFRRIAVDQRSHLPPRDFELLFRQLAEMMDTGRVAIHFGQTGH